MPILIKSGTLITAAETYVADILIDGETIAMVGANLDIPGAQVIDAQGKLVMPGGIDPHTHFDLPMFGTVSSDDHYTGHKAAAFGGTTTWRMINRGCRCDLVHFHSHPLVDKTTQEQAKDLAAVLAQWQFRTRLWLVPLAEIQKEVRLKCPEPLRVILYRRFMVRIAQMLARRRRCRALVTGESLGQVASQTLENIATVAAAATMPVLRPLVGTDKREIIALAEKLGTYQISVRPDQDCCQLFVPKKPATRSWPSQAEAAEAELDLKALVEDALARTEKVDIG